MADTLVDETYEIFDHTACHYSDIQRASGTALSGRGSFGAVVNVVEFAEQLRFGDSPARYFGATTGTFEELSIGVYTDGSPDSDLFIRLDAPQGLYDRAELRFIGEELISCVRAVLAAGDRPVGALDVSGGAGRDRVLAAPDASGAPLPGLTVPELFARQAEHAPHAVALVAGDISVSYRELDERSGRLAAALRGRDIGPEDVVAVALPRSPELAVALLAVARAAPPPCPSTRRPRRSRPAPSLWPPCSPTPPRPARSRTAGTCRCCCSTTSAPTPPTPRAGPPSRRTRTTCWPCCTAPDRTVPRGRSP
ncbi:AMP-binding protein [Streptomyces werraensis]|nr:AMP-binding protein [Streptomyces werraensis]